MCKSEMPEQSKSYQEKEQSPLSTLLFDTTEEVLANAISQEKKITGNMIICRWWWCLSGKPKRKRNFKGLEIERDLRLWAIKRILVSSFSGHSLFMCHDNEWAQNLQNYAFNSYFLYFFILISHPHPTVSSIELLFQSCHSQNTWSQKTIKLL